MMIVSAWTDVQVDRLRTMWRTNSAREIASAVGMSRDAVLGKARRLKLPSKCITQIRQRRLKLPSKCITQILQRELQKLSEQPESFEPLNISFAAIGKHQCRWITVESPSRLYCGHAVRVGTNWCPTHYAIVYVPAVVRRRQNEQVPA